MSSQWKKFELDSGDHLTVAKLRATLKEWNIPFASNDNKACLQRLLRDFVVHRNSLLGVCENGNIDEVRTFIQIHGTQDINKHGAPLAISVYRNCPDIVEHLIHLGADPNIKCKVHSPSDISHQTPLAIAILKNHHSLVEYLLDNGSDANLTSGDFSVTPLHLACSPKRQDRKIFFSKVDITLSDPAHVECVRLLLSKGADVNRRSRVSPSGIRYELTALHEACKSRSIEMVKLLVQAGADVNAPNAFGETPLHFLCHWFGDFWYKLRDGINDKDDSDSVEILKFLISKGANVTAENYWNRWDPNFIAVTKERPSWTYPFLWMGLTEEGRVTPLHHACLTNKPKCLRILLDYGAKFTHLGTFKDGRKTYKPNMRNKAEAFSCMRESSITLNKSVREWFNYQQTRKLLLLLWHFSSVDVSASSDAGRKPDLTAMVQALTLVPILRTVKEFLVYSNDDYLSSAEAFALLT